MREAIIKLITDLTEIVHTSFNQMAHADSVGFKKLFKKPCRHNSIEKNKCTMFNSCPHVLIHPSGLAHVNRQVWHGYCKAWHQFYNFPDSFSRGLSCIHAHTSMCTPTHIRRLISTIGSEILGALVCCFQLRVRTGREWGREGERESLCDIRPWDRRGCRESDRINGH